MSAPLAGRVALVTGGGSGIGRAVALALAGDGARVAVVGRRRDALLGTVERIERQGGQALAVPADVRRDDQVTAAVDTVAQRLGGLHVAVNSAGVVAGGSVADLDPQTWQAMLEINVSGVFHALRHEVRHMRAHGGGVIVNVASNIGAHRRVAGLSAYAATKAAVSALTRGAALEHIGQGVRINAVSPGPTETPLSLRPGETPVERAERLRETNPSGRAARLDEVVAAVQWLCREESSYVVGADLVVDGGAAA